MKQMPSQSFRLLGSVLGGALISAAALTSVPAAAQAVIVAPMAPPRAEVVPGPLALGPRPLRLGAGSLGAARTGLALDSGPLGLIA